MGLDGRLGIIWSSYYPDGTSAWPCPPVAQAVSDLNWEKLYWKCCAMQYPFDTRTSCNARVDCASRRPRPREWPFRTLSPRAFSSPPPCLSSPDRKSPGCVGRPALVIILLRCVRGALFNFWLKFSRRLIPRHGICRVACWQETSNKFFGRPGPVCASPHCEAVRHNRLKLDSLELQHAPALHHFIQLWQSHPIIACQVEHKVHAKAPPFPPLKAKVSLTTSGVAALDTTMHNLTTSKKKLAGSAISYHDALCLERLVEFH